MTSNSPLVLLDPFGASGGVGRAFRELLGAFSRSGTETVCCGLSHVVESLKRSMGETGTVRFKSLDQPALAPYAMGLRARVRFLPRSVHTSSAILRAALTRSASGANSPRMHRLLINYPQIWPPPSRERGFSVLIYDLNWLAYPGNFRDPSETDSWCREWIERAAHVVAISEVTRDEVIRAYGCAPDSVIAAPLAPFFEVRRAGVSNDTQAIVGGLQDGRFYLYPAAWGIHKGFETLTEALEGAKNTDPVVVTCGDPLDGAEESAPGIAELRKALSPRWGKLIAAGRLVVLRYLRDSQIDWLRRRCKAFLLPSEYEGFGLPLAEAICGCRPAIATSIPAHLEILARYPQYELATLFEPGSADALARILNQDCVDASPEPERWKEKIEGTWSWGHAARRIVTALN